MMNGNSQHKNQNFSENLLNGYSNDASGSSSDGYATIPTSPSINSWPSNNYSCSGLSYIEHRVTRMDTLAGVAIKYGVEVADIRRMNGLVTDLQMFALASLRIPHPGRHPPSPIMSNGSATNGEHTPPPPPRRSHDDMLDSLQSLKLKPPRRVSPAMSSLQGYYGLTTPPKKPQLLQGTEMSVYKTNRSFHLEEENNSRRGKDSTASDPGLGQHRKSRSLVSLQNGDSISNENGESSEADKSIRRRQKADIIDTSLQTPEIVLKEDSSGRGFLGKIGKNLALRSKLDAAATKCNSTSPIGDFFSDVFVSMRKSSSTSNLQESESANSSIWPTSKWSLKPDVISMPIFDGFPKPMNARRNKAALD